MGRAVRRTSGTGAAARTVTSDEATRTFSKEHAVGHRVTSQDRTDPDVRETDRISRAQSTELLRRCTGLSARARVESMGERHAASGAELLTVLEQIIGWDDAVLEDTDVTMLALAGASLDDLRRRVCRSADPELYAAVVQALGAVRRRLGVSEHIVSA